VEPFIEDMFADGMIYGLFYRSPIAHGTIDGLSLPGHVPEGYGIITAADIPGTNSLTVFENSMPLLAEKELLYKGQPIAVIYGPDERQLVQIASDISLDVTEKPAEDFAAYQKNQIIDSRTIMKGDPEKEMSSAFQVVEGEYSATEHHSNSSDAQGAFSIVDGEMLIVYTPSRWIFHAKDSVCDATAKPKKNVIIRATKICPSSKGNLWYSSFMACCAAMVTVRSGKPCRFILNNRENFHFASIQSPVTIHHKTALNKEGDPVAMEIAIRINCGAFPLFTREIRDRISIGAAGAYSCKNIKISTEMIRTNTPPGDTLYGLGLSQAFFATEAHFSRIAEVLQICPTDWKSKNILKKGSAFVTGGAIGDDSPEETLLEEVAKKADFRRKHAAYEMQKKRRGTVHDNYFSNRGIGLSVAYQGNGFHGRREEKGAYSVSVSLDTESKVTIKTSTISGKEYIDEIWKNNASRILGIDSSLITVAKRDTSLVVDTGPSIGSRNIAIVTKLIDRCCQTIQKKRFRNPLPIEVKRSFRLPKSHHWDERTFVGKPFPYLSWGAAVVEVEVDPVFLKPSIKGIWMVADCGELYDEKKASASVSAEILQVLDWISSAPYHPDKLSWLNYTFSTTGTFELPLISIDFISTSKKTSAGGVGDLPSNLLPAAYISAVSQATGYYIDTLPITPDRIHAYQEEQ
jgi:CO/xanthine dehydrogenase Mo-binding subunit